MKIQIGMSSCLAGHFVRYDGESEYQQSLYQQLKEEFSLLTFCPEVAIGLSIPRPPIQLREIDSLIYVRDKQTGKKDYTEALQNYAKLIAKRYPNLLAYIFKQSSPSCGLGKTKLHDENGIFLTQYTDGVFAKQLQQTMPQLLCLTEDKLQTQEQITSFLQQLQSITQLASDRSS